MFDRSIERRWALAILASFALGGILPAQQAPNRIYFSQVWGSAAENKKNPDGIAIACASWLGTAKRTLDVCCHEINNEDIIQAILAAHRRGVKVRVITETDYEKDAGPIAFTAAGIPVVSDHRSALMHNKFAVVDGSAVWTGSFNFTDNCAFKNNNNGLWLPDATLAGNYSAWFEWFWESGHRNRRAGVKKTPNPIVTLARGSRLESYFTSFDELDQVVVQRVSAAKKSIRFLAFSFTHAEICKAMLERAAAGVRVQGVFEARNAAGSVIGRFKDHPNCEVHQDGNRFSMHHKVIIIDDAIVITGSFNFSVSAAKDNDENLLVIHNRNAALKFSEEFDRVFAVARGKDSVGQGRPAERVAGRP